MSLHEDLLAALRSVANVQLVARLRDERLNFPQVNELHVFVPDIHLITAARHVEGGYQYGTNYPELLETVVKSLRALQAAAAPAGEVVVCIRLATCSIFGGRWMGLTPTPARHRPSRTITGACWRPCGIRTSTRSSCWAITITISTGSPISTRGTGRLYWRLR